MIKAGIDILHESPEAVLKGRNIALITGSANIDSNGVPVFQVVKKLAGKKLTALWSLQHGFFVDKQDNMILSDSFIWKDFDLNIKSLYGEKLLPEEEWLRGIDALLVDVVDVGVRVYTFLNHVARIMKCLSGNHIAVIILDRPNPLNGSDVEGNLSTEEYFSIVGDIPIPMRHALSAGEFLSYALTYYSIDLELEIVKVQGWQRDSSATGIWTYPSPNMPSFKTALVYPGAVLLEGTNLSEGRGTTRPFEFTGAPFIDNLKLVKELEGLHLPGVRFIPVFFKPEFSKYSGEVCKGILVHPEDIVNFRSFAVYYEIIRLVMNHYPGKFFWKEPPYEFEYERPPIDMICGSDFIRKSIEKNVPFKEIKAKISAELRDYREVIENFLLY
ncbi:exo-beta-N-acetylmuramidase NamZ domain-containing protein [Acidobacteriota bacterium]